MQWRIQHGAEDDSTGVSSSAPETAEGQEMQTRISALEHQVTRLTEQLAVLTTPGPLAAAPAKAAPPTLPQRTPHQGAPAKAPPLGLPAAQPLVAAPALAAAVPASAAAAPPVQGKAPPMTQAEAIRRRLEAEEEQAKAQEKEERIRRSAEWDDGWWWCWSESRWKHKGRRSAQRPLAAMAAAPCALR